MLAHPWVTEDMPQGLGDLNDDILLSSPRTAARRGVMASLARRDTAFGTGPGQGGFSVGQTEVRLPVMTISSSRLRSMRGSSPGAGTTVAVAAMAARRRMVMVPRQSGTATDGRADVNGTIDIDRNSQQ